MLLEEEMIFELQVWSEDYVFPCSPHPLHFSVPPRKSPLGLWPRREERPAAELFSSGVRVGSQSPPIRCKSGTQNEGPDSEYRPFYAVAEPIWDY